jgi:Uma2 family endonuclease
MTITDHPVPDIAGIPLTVDEFDALPEKPRKELVDGLVHVMPRSTKHHQQVMRKLANELEANAPSDLEVVAEIDIQLKERLIRSPDVAVVVRTEEDRKRYAAGEVTLAVEIVSPSSGTVDRDHKPVEYAHANVPHYWRVELTPELTVHTFRLGETGQYLETGLFTPGDSIKAPGLAWATVDVARLLPR